MFDACCPHCPAHTKIRYARLLEPIEQVTESLHGRIEFDDTPSRYSIRPAGSSESTSRSGALSHSTSRSSAQPESQDVPPRRLSPVLDSISAVDSPVTTNSTFPRSVGFSETSIPPLTPVTSISATTRSTSISSPLPSSTSPKKGIIQPQRPNAPSKMPLGRNKSTSTKDKARAAPLPKAPQYCFSSAADSLLFWGDHSRYVIRYDFVNLSGELVRSFRYDVEGVEYAAAGAQTCVVIASDGEVRILLLCKQTCNVDHAADPPTVLIRRRKCSSRCDHYN
jgi:hypothetical protein